jgi:hypothetical protein
VENAGSKFGERFPETGMYSASYLSLIFDKLTLMQGLCDFYLRQYLRCSPCLLAWQYAE